MEVKALIINVGLKQESVLFSLVKQGWAVFLATAESSVWEEFLGL